MVRMAAGCFYQHLQLFFQLVPQLLLLAHASGYSIIQARWRSRAVTISRPGVCYQAQEKPEQNFQGWTGVRQAAKDEQTTQVPRSLPKPLG